VHAAATYTPDNVPAEYVQSLRITQLLVMLDLCTCACLQLLLADEPKGKEQRAQRACGRQLRIDASQVLSILDPKLYRRAAWGNTPGNLLHIAVESLHGATAAAGSGKAATFSNHQLRGCAAQAWQLVLHAKVASMPATAGTSKPEPSAYADPVVHACTSCCCTDFVSSPTSPTSKQHVGCTSNGCMK
jgi:hypothetical protein